MFARPTQLLFCFILGLAGCTAKISVPSSGSDSVAAGPGGASTTVQGGSGTAVAPGTCGDPGSKVLQRLNNAEYDNTVRDLLGDDTHPASAFPPDGVALGFDNEADVLSTSPLLVEKYGAAAKALVDGALDSGRRSSIVSCDVATGAQACVLSTVRDFAKRAFRRPLDGDTDSRLAGLVTTALGKGASSEQALRTTLRAILLSPRFVFRVELDADPSSSAAHALDGYELGARLSYFIWSSMPDAALFAAAEGGQLASAEQISAAVKRLLADPKAAALSDNFAGQYLGIRRVASATPNAKFSAWNEDVRSDFTVEAKTFFSSFLSENKPVAEMLTADYTYLSDRLAGYYGLPLPGSAAFVRSSTAGTARGGILRLGAWLLTTSTPTRTSPVRRGKWVLGELLCQEPPPPPPNVAALVETDTPTGTLRERMEQHRSSPACASCHSLMDPIGLSFEHYDAIGQYRETDAGYAIDAAGTLPDGRTFDGPLELATLVAQDPAFSRCFSSKMLRYALGRSEQTGDACMLDQLSTKVAGPAFGMSDLVTAIATSQAFTTRRGGPEGTQP